MLQLYLSMIEEPEQRDQFEQLYFQYRKLMFYAANKILKDDFLSEDAVHQAFLRIIPYLDRLEDVACHKTKSFVVIVVESVSKDLHRKRKRENIIEIDEWAFETDREAQTEDTMLGRISAERIKNAIRSLPEGDREVLWLRYIEDRNDREIAKMLSISHNAVRKRIERARKRLAVVLGKG